MTRKEYIKYCQTHKHNGNKKTTTPMQSVTDPTFAQTGRQMIENPLNVNYRVQYAQGAPLDKDNPYHVNSFDNMYGDKFQSMKEAKQHIEKTKGNVQKIHDHYQKQQQNNNPEN